MAYIEGRQHSVDDAVGAVVEFAQSVVAEEPQQQLILEAARIKTTHPVSYADAFAVATAERHRLPLLTGDPELIGLDREHLQVVDIRPKEEAEATDAPDT